MAQQRERRTWGTKPDLFSPPQLPEHWFQIPVPVPERAGGTSSEEYARKWRLIRSTCEALDWGPLTLTARGIEGLDRERVARGRAPWSTNTKAVLSAVVRAAGLGGDPQPTAAPPERIAPRTAQRLWQPSATWTEPAAWRSAAVAHLSWHLPLTTATWIALAADEIVERGGVLHVEAHGTRHVLEPGPETAWRAWTARRREPARAALTTTRSSRTTRAGAPLSGRAFQAAWAAHAGAHGLDVTFDGYRLAALRAGAAHPGGRGGTAQHRRSRREATAD